MDTDFTLLSVLDLPCEVVDCILGFSAFGLACKADEDFPLLGIFAPAVAFKVGLLCDNDLPDLSSVSSSSSSSGYLHHLVGVLGLTRVCWTLVT